MPDGHGQAIPASLAAEAIAPEDHSSTDTDTPNSQPSQPIPEPGKPLYAHPTVFEVEKHVREAAGLPPHAPFASRGEWELTEILIKSGISQGYADKLLKSDMVCHLHSILGIKPPEHSPLICPLVLPLSRLSSA